MTNSVLITGASGLIGHRLTQHLLQKGCLVAHLGRSPGNQEVESFRWDPSSGRIDLQAFEGRDSVIHLAGANVNAKRWSASYKREILASRIKSTALLREKLRQAKSDVKTVVMASAIGIYGFSLKGDWCTEESPAGSDFLADVVKQWEAEADAIASLGIRLVKIRIGIVLTPEGGALREMSRPIRWGIGAPLASGMQWVSWIHRDDLCGIFASALEQASWSGAFNAAAPNPVTNAELTTALANAMGRRIFFPTVPSFALRLVLGGMAEQVINGCRVSSTRVQQAGYRFLYPEIHGALTHLMAR